MPFDWDIVVEPGNTQKASAVFMNAAAVSAGPSTPRTPRPSGPSYLTTSRAHGDDAARLELGAAARSTTQSAFDRLPEQTPPANRQAVFDALGKHRAAAGHRATSSEMQDIVTKR